MAKKKKENDFDFERALEELEKIVADLEGGDMSLDGALVKYEKGVELAEKCQEKLDSARFKVEELLKREDGSFEKKPFPELETEE